MRNLLVATILFCSTLCANAAIALPPNLIGTWVKPDSEFKGEALIKGAAIYLDSDGIGGFIGGNGKDVIGVRTIVTAYDPNTNTLNYDLTENGKIVFSGTMVYDPAKKILFSPKDSKETYERRLDVVPATVRKSLGLEAKTK